MTTTLLFVMAWFGFLGGNPETPPEKEAEALFAAGVIQPSEAALDLIDRTSSESRAPAPIPLNHQQTLDQALVAGDWQGLDEGLVALYKEAGPQAALDWLSTRHAAGYLVASMHYARYSLAIGETENREDLKTKSTMLWLYSVATILVDGAKCADSDASVLFAKQTNKGFAKIRRHAMTLSSSELQDSQKLATSLEKQIAPDRAADPTICAPRSLSLEALAKNFIDHLEHGEWNDTEFDVTEESEGSITLMSREPLLRDFKPAIKRADVWRDEAAKRRVTIPDVLTRMIVKIKK